MYINMTKQVNAKEYACNYVRPMVRDCFSRFDWLFNLNLPALNIVECELACEQIRSGYSFVELGPKYEVLLWLREWTYQPKLLVQKLEQEFVKIQRPFD